MFSLSECKQIITLELYLARGFCGVGVGVSPHFLCSLRVAFGALLLFKQRRELLSEAPPAGCNGVELNGPLLK
jgi:hypothetical protein